MTEEGIFECVVVLLNVCIDEGNFIERTALHMEMYKNQIKLVLKTIFVCIQGQCRISSRVNIAFLGNASICDRATVQDTLNGKHTINLGFTTRTHSIPCWGMKRSEQDSNYCLQTIKIKAVLLMTENYGYDNKRYSLDSVTFDFNDNA